MYKMRHIATSHEGSVFLTAEFKKKVFCWNLNTYELIAEFNTVLDFGGKRLDVSEDGTRCVAAAYSRHGVSMYNALTGSVVWIRKDIKKTQFIKFNPSNEKIYIGIDGKSMVTVNKTDGSDDEKIKSATEVYFDASLSEPIYLKGQNQVIGNGLKITCPTFAFLDVQPIGSGVVLSAVCSELMYYDYAKKKIVWRITPKENEHFLKIAYSAKNCMVYSILYKYNVPREEPYYFLYGISTLDGSIKFIFPLPIGSCEFGFAQGATKLICSSGEIIGLSGAEPELIHKINWD